MPRNSRCENCTGETFTATRPAGSPARATRAPGGRRCAAPTPDRQDEPGLLGERHELRGETLPSSGLFQRSRRLHARDAAPCRGRTAAGSARRTPRARARLQAALEGEARLRAGAQPGVVAGELAAAAALGEVHRDARLAEQRLVVGRVGGTERDADARRERDRRRREAGLVDERPREARGHGQCVGRVADVVQQHANWSRRSGRGHRRRRSSTVRAPRVVAAQDLAQPLRRERSSSSPAACPSASLTRRKLSRSMHSSATVSPEPVAACTAWRRLRRNSARPGRPVSRSTSSVSRRRRSAPSASRRARSRAGAPRAGGKASAGRRAGRGRTRRPTSAGSRPSRPCRRRSRSADRARGCARRPRRRPVPAACACPGTRARTTPSGAGLAHGGDGRLGAVAVLGLEAVCVAGMHGRHGRRPAAQEQARAQVVISARALLAFGGSSTCR